MPTLLQVALLIKAFEQLDWHIECQSEMGESQKTQEIVGSRIDGTTLILSIKNGPRTEVSLAVEMTRVNLRGEFGIAAGEPRRFSVSCFSFSDSKKDRIRDGIPRSFLREIDQQDVGLIFVRDKDAPPGWPIDKETPYGFGMHLTRYGTDNRRLRTIRFAQPLALLPGDTLETGAHVRSFPRCGEKGTVLVHIDDCSGSTNRWFSIPALLPVALRAEEDASS